MTTINMMNYMKTSDVPYSLPPYYDPRLRQDIINDSFWGNWKGKENSGMPIITKYEMKTEDGETILIHTKSKLRMPARTGDQTLMGYEGKYREGRVSVTLDWARFGVSENKKMSKASFWNFQNSARKDLSERCAMYDDWMIFSRLIYTDVSATTTLYSNSKSAVNQLDSSCTFGTNEILKIKVALGRKGAIPLRVTMRGKEKIFHYGIVISEIDEHYLFLDPVWNEYQEALSKRGEFNPIGKGYIGEYLGMEIYTHRTRDPEMGTPIRPNCFVYGDVGDSDVSITCGEYTDVAYTENFPDSGYICVRRIADGKKEIIYYGSKSDYSFDDLVRVGTAWGDIAGEGKLTFSSGDIITLNYQMSYQVGFGADVLAQGWGQKPESQAQVIDYNFVKGIGVDMMLGCAAFRNTRNVAQNYVVNCSYAGLSDFNI